ncbi:MAG: TRAP transporter large permease [Candidatus Dormibacteraceae bacterium]
MTPVVDADAGSIVLPSRGYADVPGGPGVVRAIDRAVEGALVVSILAELVLLFGNTMIRLLVHQDFVWTSEAVQFPLAVMMWLGAPFALRRGLHISVRVFLDRVPASVAEIFEAVAQWLVVGTGLGMLLVLSNAMQQDFGVKTPILQLPETAYLVPAPFGVCLLIGLGLSGLKRTQWWKTLAIGGCLALLAAVLVLVGPQLASGLSSQAVLLGLIVLGIVSLLIGVPIAFVLINTSFLFLILSGIAPPSTVILRIQDATQQVVLVTIPFFILAGALMATGGLATRLSDMIGSLVGHFRGGLYYVLVIFMFFFSGLSGSKVADMAAVGRTMSPALARGRYLKGESAACLAACGAMYETVPPSITLLVLSSVTGLSLASLFLAGFLPAVVLALGTMLWIFIRRDRFAVAATAPSSWAFRVRAVGRSLPALVLPVILVGGIVTGIGDPVEVSSFAVVYALIASLFFGRRTMVSDSWRSLCDASALTGMILLLVAAASAFAWVLTVSFIPQDLAEALQLLRGLPIAFLVASVLALVAMGAILEGLPAIVILPPLLIPVATAAGISALHYSVVLVLAMGVGFFLPVVGIGSYMACAIVGTDMKSITRPLVGYACVILLIVLVIAFVPSITLTLPNLVGGR